MKVSHSQFQSKAHQSQLTSEKASYGLWLSVREVAGESKLQQNLITCHQVDKKSTLHERKNQKRKEKNHHWSEAVQPITDHQKGNEQTNHRVLGVLCDEVQELAK